MTRTNGGGRRGPEGKVEIKFDSSARNDYLTGFHKRKLQRAKLAQDKAEKAARAQRIEMRKSLRDSRKKDLESHVAAVNSMIRKLDDKVSDNGHSSNGDSSPWEGFSEVDEDELQREDNFVDEGRLTSVIVEAVDIDKDGFCKSEEDAGRGEATMVKNDNVAGSTRRKINGDGRVKKKKRPFRYESKVERKAKRIKQVAGARAKAKKRKE